MVEKMLNHVGMLIKTHNISSAACLVRVYTIFCIVYIYNMYTVLSRVGMYAQL